MKRIIIVLGALLGLLAMPGTVSANHATGVEVDVNCNGSWSVVVSYAQFGGGHHLITTITGVDGSPEVHDVTPTGSGNELYEGTGGTTVDVTVTTPQDDNAPLVSNGHTAKGCETPPPTPTPEPDAPKLSVDCDGVTASGISDEAYPAGWQIIVEPGDVLLANGHTDLSPGDYTAQFRLDGSDRDGGPGKFTVEGCATPTPPPCEQTEAGCVHISAQVAPCPDKASPTAGIRFIGLLLLLHVKVDGVEVTPDANGDVVVAPGLHHWEVLDAAGVNVLAEGDINCPTCSEPVPPDDVTLPPTNMILAAEPLQGRFDGVIVLLVALAGMAVGGLAITWRLRKTR